MRKLGIDRLDAAVADMEEIWFNIALENRRAAFRVVEALDRRILQLAHFPEIGTARPDVADGMRMLVEGNYLILYRITETRVEIVRVIHGARDLTTLF